MHDFFAAVGVLRGQIECRLVDSRGQALVSACRKMSPTWKSVRLGSQELFITFRQLFHRLLHAWLRKTQTRHKFRQLFLVLRRMKPSIKRQPADTIVKTALHDLRLLHNHLFVTLVARHHAVMNHKAGTVFKHKHLAPELNWFARFASLVKLSVRLKHAEQLVRVWHQFIQDDSPLLRVLNTLGSCDVGLQRILAEHVFLRGCGHLPRFAEFTRSSHNESSQLQQFLIRLLQMRLVIGSLPPGDAINASRYPPDSLSQMFVLSPA